MRRFATSFVSLAIVGALAIALSACGSDSTTTSTTTVEQTTTSAAPTSTTATSTTTTATTTGSSTSGVETTPGGAVVPKTPDCGQGEIYSQGAGACVTQGSGTNPCPKGETPAADQPACLPKD